MKQTILSSLCTVELSLGADGAPPSEFRVFSAGRFATTKGEFNFDELAAKCVLAEAADYGNDFPVDYEHAMLDWMSSASPSERGKAAGWIPNKALELRNGELWATGVTWTPDAAAKLKSREYRYLSPAFVADEQGRVTRFLNIALTNLPATKRMDPLVLADLPRRVAHPETSMNPLLIALGLAETTPETDAVAHATKVRELVALTGKTAPAEALGVVTAWKEAAGRVEALATELSQLKAAALEAEVLSLVDGAVKAGKATPAQRDMLLAMGRKDAVMLKAFLDAAPVIVPAQTATPVVTTSALSAEELAVARQLGLDPKKLSA